jgi:hypothetical protein
MKVIVTWYLVERERQQEYARNKQEYVRMLERSMGETGTNNMGLLYDVQQSNQGNDHFHFFKYYHFYVLGPF